MEIIEQKLKEFEEYRKQGDPCIGISDQQAEWIKDFLRPSFSSVALATLERVRKTVIENAENGVQCGKREVCADILLELSRLEEELRSK